MAPSAEKAGHLADPVGDLLHVQGRVVLVDVHGDPAGERLFGRGAVALLVHPSRAVRTRKWERASGEGRPMLEDIVEVHRSSAGDEMGLVWHAFRVQRFGELRGRAMERRDVQLEQIEEEGMLAPSVDGLRADAGNLSENKTAAGSP